MKNLGKLQLVENKDHVFGEADKYIITTVEHEGETLRLAMTETELRTMKERADRNCEDFEDTHEHKTLLGQIWHTIFHK